MTKRYDGVLNIPEGKCGDYEIKHKILPAGSSLPTASLRTSVFGGHNSEPITFEEDTRWHYLVEGGAVWMSDIPLEQFQHDEHLRGFSGRVLVGGLGLGYAAKTLCEMEEVTEVVVVEISKEVIDLVAPHIQHSKLTVVHMDIFEYLEELHSAFSNPDREEIFDFAFYDIWRSDGEGTFLDTVVPLRKLSQGMTKDANVVCWNEDIMRGQMMFNLQGRIAICTSKFAGVGFPVASLDDFCEEQEGPGSQYNNWCLEFFRALKEEKFTTEDTYLVTKFVHLYGRPGWLENWETLLDEVRRSS